MQLSFRLKKTPEFIFDYLTDRQKFISVHPVISQMDETGQGSFLVHETLKLGPVPFSFTYPVTIEKNRVDRVVVIRATVMKLTRIEIKFVLKAVQDDTLVEETIVFASPLPVEFLMQRIFKKQHTQLFKNIELQSDTSSESIV